MCEVLVKAMANYVSEVPEINNGIYQTGDLVLGFEDGHQWGRDELLPPAQGGAFVRWVIPDMTLEEFKAWGNTNYGCDPFVMISHEVASAKPATLAGEPEPPDVFTTVIEARRRIYVDPNNLPVTMPYSMLLQSGSGVFPPDTRYIKDKTQTPPSVLLVRGVNESL